MERLFEFELEVFEETLAQVSELEDHGLLLRQARWFVSHSPASGSRQIVCLDLHVLPFLLVLVVHSVQQRQKRVVGDPLIACGQSLPAQRTLLQVV